MAGLILDVNLPSTSLTASTKYYLCTFTAPAQQRIRIRSFELYGNANSAQAPGLLQFCTCTSAGSVGSAITPKPREGDNAETPQGTYGFNNTAITETAFNSRFVNPQIGVILSFPDPDGYFIKGGTFWTIIFTPGFTANYAGLVEIEE
jgi:hypothetical protein